MGKPWKLGEKDENLTNLAEESLLTLKIILWIKKSQTTWENLLGKFTFFFFMLLWALCRVDTREICDVGNKIFHWIDNQLNKLSLNMKNGRKLFSPILPHNGGKFAFVRIQPLKKRMICCRFDVFLLSPSPNSANRLTLSRGSGAKVWKLILNWNFGNLISLVTCNALVEDIFWGKRKV